MHTSGASRRGNATLRLDIGALCRSSSCPGSSAKRVFALDVQGIQVLAASKKGVDCRGQPRQDAKMLHRGWVGVEARSRERLLSDEHLAQTFQALRARRR